MRRFTRSLTADEFDAMVSAWERKLDAKVEQFSKISDPVMKAHALFLVINKLPADACHLSLNSFALALCKGEDTGTPEELYRWAVDWLESPVSAYAMQRKEAYELEH